MPSGLEPIPKRPTASSALARNPPSRKIRKAHGIHYTPSKLADYLAKNVVASLINGLNAPPQLTILDPACGDGELLNAVFHALPPGWRKSVVLAGRDKDARALAEAKKTLQQLPLTSVDLQEGDFLELAPISTAGGQTELRLFGPSESSGNATLLGQFDAVISNPPYVRTQVLGS